ncbi:MAG: 1-acyl-sn-glycerol-3-phosphate acyltransferase [Gammaproteobacteria bacterium]|nr:1-acyl-sn-glycerol-3-phosphate acyltransferase [Gammaproteobacteria bacterium]MDJ0872389.1 1-acyl-sn-glycerol-3-phosphate acyltransferase [Gammaproteobacteria bacterium]
MTRTYRSIIAVTRVLVRIFFRQVEVTGEENVPETGGGIVVAAHPNGLVDPILILTYFPRPIVFGARHGLFRWPLLGWIMRQIGTVPLYRAVDTSGAQGKKARRAGNKKALDALAGAVAGGRFTALFPEGVSHDEPRPQEIRTGAARLFYSAIAQTPKDAPPPAILPVGLHYDQKNVFRSDAVVVFHPPLPLDAKLMAPPLPDEPEEDLKARYAGLTREIEQALHEVVYAVDSWEIDRLLQRTSKLVRAERAHRAGSALSEAAIGERLLGFARVWSGFQERASTHPEETDRLMERLGKYDRDLRALHLEDHELDETLQSDKPWRPFVLVLHALFVYFLMPPLLLFGVAVNALTALGLIAVTKYSAKLNKDEATIKLLVGAVAFPITWLVAAILAGWAATSLHEAYPFIPEAPMVAAIATFIFAAVGGVLAVRYRSLARETRRALQVRLTRAKRSATIERLRAERSAIFEAVMALAKDLQLPGSVAADGRIVASND